MPGLISKLFGQNVKTPRFKENIVVILSEENINLEKALRYGTRPVAKVVSFNPKLGYEVILESDKSEYPFNSTLWTLHKAIHKDSDRVQEHKYLPIEIEEEFRETSRTFEKAVDEYKTRSIELNRAKYLVLELKDI